MSDIKFYCPHCKQPLAAPDEMNGVSLACPSCNQMIVVQTEDSCETVVPIAPRAPLKSQPPLDNLTESKKPPIDALTGCLSQLQQIARETTPKFLSLQNISQEAYRRLSVELPTYLSQHETQYPNDDNSIVSICETLKTFVSIASERFKNLTETPPPKGSESQTRWKAHIDSLIDNLVRLSTWIPPRPKQYAFALHISETSGFGEAIMSEFRQWCDKHGGVLITETNTPASAHVSIFISASNKEGAYNVLTPHTHVDMSVSFRVIRNDDTKDQAQYDILLNTTCKVGASTGYGLPLGMGAIKSQTTLLAESVVREITKTLEAKLGQDNWQAIREPLAAMRRATASAWLVCPRCGFHHLHVLHLTPSPCLACGADTLTGHTEALLKSQTAADRDTEAGCGCLVVGILAVVIIAVFLRPLTFWSSLLIAVILIPTIAYGGSEIASGRKKTQKAQIALQADEPNLEYPEWAAKNAQAIKQAESTLERQPEERVK